ncbi:MAG: DUF1330 domain-containing protein [Vicinamibacterales bacterium]|jgi:uncharacterized protein (DUF1330 family)
MAKAYLIGHVTVKNPDQFLTEYGAKVEATITAFNGRFLARGGEVTYREGEPLGDINVIVEFPDRSTATAWLNSDAYQAILPGRTENTDGHILIMDGVPD